MYDSPGEASVHPQSPFNRWFPEPTRVWPLRWQWIGLAVFAQLTRVSITTANVLDRLSGGCGPTHTDAQTTLRQDIRTSIIIIIIIISQHRQ